MERALVVVVLDERLVPFGERRNRSELTHLDQLLIERSSGSDNQIGIVKRSSRYRAPLYGRFLHVMVPITTLVRLELEKQSPRYREPRHGFEFSLELFYAIARPGPS